MTGQRLLVRTALCAYLVFAVPHLIFHATHLEHFDTASALTALAGLAVSVALPAALLTLTITGNHPPTTKAREGTASGTGDDTTTRSTPPSTRDSR